MKIISITVRRGTNGKTWALAQIMAWRQTGDKPWSEVMMVKFIEACICLLS